TTASPAPSNMTAAGQKMSVSAEMGIMQSSPVRRVGGAIRCDLRLVLVTHRQQLFLRHDLFAALLEVKVGNTRLDDRVNRARFLAEAAVDALEQVDVVARGTACAVLAHLGIDGDRERGTHRFTQLAGDATLFAIRIAALRVQAAEARRLRRFLLGVIDGDLRLEEILQRQRQARPQLRQEPRLDPGIESLHVATGFFGSVSLPSRISSALPASTT